MPAENRFKFYGPGLDSPPAHLEEITPNDSAELAYTTRAINVAVAGDLRVETIHGDVATVFVAAGVPFPIQARKVFASGTTASGIVGMS